MTIEIFQLQNGPKKLYHPLGEISSVATPVKGTFIFFNKAYYLVDMVVIADKRTLVFVGAAANVIGLTGIL